MNFPLFFQERAQAGLKGGPDPPARIHSMGWAFVPPLALWREAEYIN